MLAKRVITIYGLSAKDGEIRYVGQTVEPKERKATHLREARKGASLRVHRWIAKLLGDGDVLQVHVLDVVPQDKANARERAVIAELKAAGARLTNLTDGGDGFRGYTPTAQQIAKTAAALRGRPRDEAARAAIKAGLNRPEVRAALSEARLGNKSRSGQIQSQEEKDKRAKANRGKTRSPEFCERMRLKATGFVHSEEAKAKMGATKRATISPERRSEIARIANLASQEAKKCRSREE